MSTRATIIIRDQSQELFFYRHSDGYPEGVKPTLMKLMEMLKSGQLRNDASQFSGWLILIGAWEYGTIPEKGEEFKTSFEYEYSKWKVGAYEPTDQISRDTEFVYIFDLIKKVIYVNSHDFYYGTGKHNMNLIETWE